MNCLPMRVNERYRKPHLNFRHNFAKDMTTHQNRCFKVCWGHWRHIAAFFVIVWVIITYSIMSPISKNVRSEKASRLKWIEEKYNSLKKNHDKMVANHAPSTTTGRVRSKVPPKEYELFRHRAYAEIVALFDYLDLEIKDMAKNPVGRRRLLAIRNLTEERKASLLTDLDSMSQSDGYAEWRQRTATATSDLLQRRLHRLQNPRDCDAARKLICEIEENCDFGCRILKLEYCMTFAYATERTVIVNYIKLESSQQIQISDTCLTCSNCSKRVEPYDEDYDESLKVVFFKANLYNEERFKFMPLTVPEDLAPLVTKFNGDPSSWWIGQMLKFILKPRPDLQRTINETIAKLDFKKPIVGIHYHRSNKMLSRGFHPSIQDYMDPVRQYYDQLELSQPVQRRVYLATDDDYVPKKAQRLYPDYIFMSNSDTSLAGLIADVTLLARTDYLVCTFSSQVSRLAYELMQARVDASKRVFSLDDSYYFGDQSRRV